MNKINCLIALILVSSVAWATEKEPCPLTLSASAPVEVPDQFVLVSPKSEDRPYRLAFVEFSTWHPDKGAIFAPLESDSANGSDFTHYQFGTGASDLWITCTYRRENVAVKMARELPGVDSCVIERQGGLIVGVRCPDDRGVRGPVHVK